MTALYRFVSSGRENAVYLKSVFSTLSLLTLLGGVSPLAAAECTTVKEGCVCPGKLGVTQMNADGTGIVACLQVSETDQKLKWKTMFSPNEGTACPSLSLIGGAWLKDQVFYLGYSNDLNIPYVLPSSKTGQVVTKRPCANKSYSPINQCAYPHGPAPRYATLYPYSGRVVNAHTNFLDSSPGFIQCVDGKWIDGTTRGEVVATRPADAY